MTNENDLTDEEFAVLKITDEEEKGLTLEWEKFKRIVAILDIPLQERTNQHKRILRQHCFTLLFSSITYGENIVAKLDCPALIDVQDEKFGTPLIYALSIQKFDIAASLLEHTDKCINVVVRGSTALTYAASNSQPDLERKIIQKGGIIPGMEFPPEKTPSEIRNALINSFMPHALLYDPIEENHPLAEFLSFCRADRKDLKFAFDPIGSLCAIDKSFYMLMRLAAYAHEARNTHVFFSSVKHRAILNLGRNRTAAFVDYVSKNIFVFYDQMVSLENMASLIHECAHLVINLIYNNYYLPYCTQEEEAEFAKIFQLTQERLQQLTEYTHRTEPPEHIRAIWATLNSVYQGYPTRQWPEELIVRIPELLVILGVQQGRNLLQELFPELFSFYYQNIVPKMYDFIASHLLKIELAGKRDCFVKIYHQMQGMLGDNVLGEELLCSFNENMLQLSLEELFQLREVALLLDYKTLTIIFNEHLLQKEKQQQREERIKTNISILNTLKLNPYHSACSNNSVYWKQFVEYSQRFGGVKRGEHRMPHTIAHIFDEIEALTPAYGPETSAPDCPPAALLETIDRAITQPSQSYASFFGLKNQRIEQLKQQLSEMKSHYQAHSH